MFERNEKALFIGDFSSMEPLARNLSAGNNGAVILVFDVPYARVAPLRCMIVSLLNRSDSSTMPCIVVDNEYMNESVESLKCTLTLAGLF